MAVSQTTRWILEPPPGEEGRAIARMLREETDYPVRAVDAGAWRKLEARLRPRRHRARWALLVLGLPALATAAGSLYVGHARREDAAPRAIRAPATSVSRSAPASDEANVPAPVLLPPAMAPVVEPTSRPRVAASAPRTPAMAAAAAEPSQADLDAIERSAASARRSGDAKGAERGYLQLARSSGLRAENALFELGLLRLHLEKDVVGALSAWAEYRRRFPAGQLATEVDLSVLGALEQAGRIPEAVREGEAFLTRRPGSERSGEVHALVGSLLQQRGDCARALPHLEAGGQALLSDARSDELAYRRALCLRALGGGETARAALRDYLDAHPHGRYRDSVEQALRE